MSNNRIHLAMSRKLKYGEPTKTVGFKVPLSKVDDVRKLVNGYLENKHSTQIYPVKIDEYANKTSEEHFMQYVSCGCIIEKGLLRRSKNSKCKLTKSEH